MICWLRHLIGCIVSVFRSWENLLLENLALRQQLLALHTKPPRRHLSTADKLFWIVLRRLWSGWKLPLVRVTPKTVVAWHRTGFRLYWKWLSRTRHAGGRRSVSKEIRSLILRMAVENPTGGAPRIHGASCSIWALISRSLRSHDGFDALRELPILPSAGSHSCEIIARRLPRWTSSQCRR